jgi:hypothetical protein
VDVAAGDAASRSERRLIWHTLKLLCLSPENVF